MSPLTPLSHTLLSAKRSKSISFADLETLLQRDEVWIATCLGSRQPKLRCLAATV